MSRLIEVDAVLLAYDYLVADVAHLAASIIFMNRNAGEIQWLRPSGVVRREFSGTIDWAGSAPLSDYARNLIKFSTVWRGLDRKVALRIDEPITLEGALGLILNLLVHQDVEVETGATSMLSALQDASRSGLDLSPGWNPSRKFGNVTKLFQARMRRILVQRQLPQDSSRTWRRPGGRHRVNLGRGRDKPELEQGN